MAQGRVFSIALRSSDPRRDRFIDIFAGVHRRLGGIAPRYEVPFNEPQVPFLGEMPIENRITANTFMHQHVVMRKTALMRLLDEEISKVCSTDLANTFDVLGQFLGNLAMQAGSRLGIRGSLAARPRQRSIGHSRQGAGVQRKRAEPRPPRLRCFLYCAGRP